MLRGAILASKNIATNRAQWHVINAEGYAVGRLADKIAPLLMGKHKPVWNPALDCGDYVVVINAHRVVLTGPKWDKKQYIWHTGWPGGIKRIVAKNLWAKHPERIIEKAVRGMLPINNLRAMRMSRLKLYCGPEHPHSAQTQHTSPEIHLNIFPEPTQLRERKTMAEQYLIDFDNYPDEIRWNIRNLHPDPVMAKQQILAALEERKVKDAEIAALYAKIPPEQRQPPETAWKRILSAAATPGGGAAAPAAAAGGKPAAKPAPAKK